MPFLLFWLQGSTHEAPNGSVYLGDKTRWPLLQVPALKAKVDSPLAASGLQPRGMTDRSRFSITAIGSLHTGWALKVDGVIRRASPSLIVLGAYVDAIMAGADEADADNIARAIEARPWPTYEERMAVFSPAGPWKPSRDPFTPRPAHKFGRADL